MKIFKLLFKITLGLILLSVVAMFAVNIFVDPNQFKGMIEQQVLAQTGQTLHLNGPITWRLFPMLSLQIEDITLDSLPKFKNKLLTAKTVQGSLSLESLMLGKALINLKLNGVHLVLEKNTSSDSNLDNLTHTILTTQTSTIETPKNKNIHVMLNGIQIEDAQITLYDDVNNKNYKIDHLNLSADNLIQGMAGVANAFSLSLNLEDINKKPLGKVNLNGEWALKTENDSLRVDKLVFKFEFPNGKSASLTGKVDIQSLSQNPRIEAKLQAQKLAFGKVMVDEVKATIKVNSGIVNIQPIEIQIAESTQHATLQIDYTGSIPKYTITEEGKNFEIKPLLAMFDVKDKLEGKTNLKIKLTTSGNASAELQKNLSGQVNIEMIDGKLQGVNFIKLLKGAQSGIHTLATSLSKKENMNLNSGIALAQEDWKKNSLTASGDFTPFNVMKGTINISNGIINNPDFSITHSEYVVSGKGNVNLVTEAIQYQTSVLLKNNPYPANDEIGNYLYKTPLPVKIQGTIKDPQIRPDFKTYTDGVWSYVQKNFIQKTVKKTINKTVEKAMEKFTDKKDLNTKINKVFGSLLEKVKKE